MMKFECKTKAVMKVKILIKDRVRSTYKLSLPYNIVQYNNYNPTLYINLMKAKILEGDSKSLLFSSTMKMSFHSFSYDNLYLFVWNDEQGPYVTYY